MSVEGRDRNLYMF